MVKKFFLTIIFFVSSTTSLATVPYKEFFLTEQQELYQDQKNNYQIIKKTARNSEGAVYCTTAITIELFKQGQLLARFLSTSLAYDYSRGCKKNIKIYPTHDGINVIDKHTSQIRSKLSIASNLCDNEKFALPVISLCLSDNEQYAACITSKRTALYWNVQTQQEIMMFNDIITIALSTDGTLFAAAQEDGSIHIFDMRTKKVSTIRIPNTFYTLIEGLAFSYDDEMLIIAATPAWKFYKSVIPHDEREIWDYIVDVHSQDLPIPHCWHYLAIFKLKNVFTEDNEKVS